MTAKSRKNGKNGKNERPERADRPERSVAAGNQQAEGAMPDDAALVDVAAQQADAATLSGGRFVNAAATGCPATEQTPRRKNNNRRKSASHRRNRTQVKLLKEVMHPIRRTIGKKASS